LSSGLALREDLVVGGYRKLNRRTGNREALFRSLVTDLFMYGRIRTTEAKAKELRKVAEKMITFAKRGDLHSRRLASAWVRPETIQGTETTQTVLQKLFTEIGPKYAERQGGYTRILKLGPRRGDATEMVYIELVD
jgi:large subunit ribosomal protein L17